MCPVGEVDFFCPDTWPDRNRTPLKNRVRLNYDKTGVYVLSQPRLLDGKTSHFSLLKLNFMPKMGVQVFNFLGLCALSPRSGHHRLPL